MRLWVPARVRHAADAAVALAILRAAARRARRLVGLRAGLALVAPGTPSGGVPPHARAQWHRDMRRRRPPRCVPRRAAVVAAATARRPAGTAGGATALEPGHRHLVLAQLPLDDVELEIAGAGRRLLLPVFDGPRHGKAGCAPPTKARRPAAVWPVRLADPWHAPGAAGGRACGRAADATDAGLYEVRSVAATPARRGSAGRLAARRPRRAPDARASLWRCAGDGGSARYLASGALMPWGDGWALHLETLAD